MVASRSRLVVQRFINKHQCFKEIIGILVVHVFGTLKFWMGATHFLTKTQPRVKTEKSLHVLAYNLRRIISLYGTEGEMSALRGAAA